MGRRDDEDRCERSSNGELLQSHKQSQKQQRWQSQKQQRWQRQQQQRQRQRQQQQQQHDRGQGPVQGPASARDQPQPAERPPELGPSEIGGASRLLPSDLQRELGTAIAWHLRQTEPARFAEGARHRVRTRTLQGASPAERLLAESGLLPYAPTRARVRIRG